MTGARMNSPLASFSRNARALALTVISLSSRLPDVELDASGPNRRAALENPRGAPGGLLERPDLDVARQACEVLGAIGADLADRRQRGTRRLQRDVEPPALPDDGIARLGRHLDRQDGVAWHGDHGKLAKAGEGAQDRRERHRLAVAVAPVLRQQGGCRKEVAALPTLVLQHG